MRWSGTQGDYIDDFEEALNDKESQMLEDVNAIPEGFEHYMQKTRKSLLRVNRYYEQMADMAELLAESPEGAHRPESQTTVQISVREDGQAFKGRAESEGIFLSDLRYVSVPHKHQAEQSHAVSHCHNYYIYAADFDNRLVRHEFQKHAGDRLAIRIYKRHRIFAVADSCRIYNLQEKEMDVGAGER